MNEQEIIDGNKLIAEFHHGTDFGWRIKTDDTSLKRGEIYVANNQVKLRTDDDDPDIELDYHSNWSRLMPVVEKIGNTEIQKVFAEVVLKTSSTCEIQIDGIYYKEGVSANLIEAIWEAVIDFIKWYNSQK